MKGKLKEKLLLLKLQTNKDPEAFAALYDLYIDRIYRFVFFKVAGHEEAEDVTSEVFLKVWHYINEGKEVKSFSGLLYKIARNSIIDLYRSKSRQESPLFLSEIADDEKTGDRGRWQEMTEAQLSVKETLEAIKKLKQEYQEVLTLKYIDELTIDEIAQIMEKKKTAVRVLLHRAIKKLNSILKEN